MNNILIRPAGIALIIFLIGCLTLLSVSSYSQQLFNYKRDFSVILENTKDKSNNLFYDSLLTRFKRNENSLSKYETLALLIAFTGDNFYDPYNDMETEKEIYNVNEAGDYETALIQSKEYLQKHPVSLRILKEVSYSYHQLGKRDSAKYYMDLVHQIMSAMIYSGKGKSPENPIFSLALNDGEQFIPNAGMTILNKSTATGKDKLFMEIIKARTEEGADINFYFVIQHAKQKMDEGYIKDRPLKKNVKSKKGESKKKFKKTNPD
ncbi:MAG: DUF4919 domain-containing protein [Ferruginibacter sp.]